MEDFKHAADSLGHWSIDNLSGVKSVLVIADEFRAAVHMRICLQVDTWENRETVIDEMLEIRQMFFDDFVLTYEFGGVEDERLAHAEGATTNVFAAA